eukprot:8190875-Pyramimonas_sp.AAC.1
MRTPSTSSESAASSWDPHLLRTPTSESLPHLRPPFVPLRRRSASTGSPFSDVVAELTRQGDWWDC